MPIVTVRCADCGSEFSCWTPNGDIPDGMRTCVSCTNSRMREAGRRRKLAEREDRQAMQAMLERIERMDTEVRRLSRLFEARRNR